MLVPPYWYQALVPSPTSASEDPGLSVIAVKPVDAVAALDKRRFAREAPVCLVTKSTAPKFKFTVKRRSQPSLSPGGVSVPGA